MKRGFDVATGDLFAGELFAGGGTMAAEAERLGYKVRVLCEKEPHLQALLKQKFKGADVQPDMYEKPWIHWAECGLVVFLLIAGFACQPFSTAGRMLEQHDPRAYQVLLVIEAAIALQTSVLLLENVLGLVTNDWRHGIYSMIKAKLHVAGFRSHRAVCALDHEVSGDTGRDRAFLLFAKSEGAVTQEMTRLKLATWAPKVWPQSVPVHDAGAVPWGRVKVRAPGQPGAPAAYITLSGANSLVGCAVSTSNSETLWRVMSQSKCGALRLMSIDRRNPEHSSAKLADVQEVEKKNSTFPVYRPGDRAPTLTASGEPPRLGAGLLVDENGDVYTAGCKARAHYHKVPEWDLQFLLETGCNDAQIRAYIGGMVTVPTARAVVQLLIEPVTHKVPEKKPRKIAHTIVSLEQPPKGSAVVVVVPTSRKGRAVQILDNSALGVKVPAERIQTGKIVPLVQHLLPGQEMALAGRCTTEAVDVWVVAALSLEDELDWPAREMAQLEDSLAHEVAALALARVMSFGGGVCRQDLQPLLEASGHTMGGAVAAAPLPQSWGLTPTDFTARKEKMVVEALRQHQELEQCIRQEAQRSTLVIRGESKQAYLQEWATQVTDADKLMREAPDTCFAQPPDFTDDRLRLMPFVDTAPIDSTDELPPVPEQEPLPADFKAQNLSDLKMPGQMDRYAAEVAGHAAFIKAISSTDMSQAQLAQARPKPSAFSERTRVPAVRGKVMDLRGKTPKLLQMNAPVDCQLDADYFEASLPGHRDNQIRQFVRHGVRSQTNLPLQSVLQSHLLSLANHTADLGKDIDRRHKIKYLQRHKKQPFDPIRLVPQGTTSKPGCVVGTATIRQVSDQGQPRKEVQDEEGSTVEVFNVQAKTHEDGTAKLPHEWKALPTHVLTNMAVLKYIGQLIGLALYIFSDDLKDFFRQLALHPSELWLSAFLWLDEEDETEFIVEERLGFGQSHASNIAQRFSNAAVAIFHKEFQKADEPYLLEDCRKHPALLQWVTDRAAALGTSAAQVLIACFYTDDLFCMVLGAERAARALGVWFEVTRKLNLLCSAPRKRLAGVVVPWTGLNYYSSLGGASLPEGKEAHAQHVLATASTGKLPVSKYRSVVGLLNWAVFALQLPSSYMYQMHGPMKRGGELERGPATWVKATVDRRAQWAMLSNLLATTCFASASMAVPGRTLPAPTAKVHAWHGDAAIKGTKWPGMCGIWKGLYWILRLAKGQLRHLHISALELLTVFANFLIFGPMLALLDTAALDSLTVLIQCDSLVSTKIMTGRRRGTVVKSAAKSPLMQHIHQQMVKHPLFQRLEKCVLVGHEWGEGNLLSDAGSRGREDKLITLCEMLDIKAEKIEVPDEVNRMMQSAVDFATRNPPLNDMKNKGMKETG